MKFDRRRIVQGNHAPEKLECARKLRQKMTPAEARLWRFLRRNSLAGLHFRRQQVIDGFIVDFYCHASGLVVEVDGEVHGAQVEYDVARMRVLVKRGLHILRFTNEQVLEDTQNVLIQIRREASTALPHP